MIELDASRGKAWQRIIFSASRKLNMIYPVFGHTPFWTNIVLCKIQGRSQFLALSEIPTTKMAEFANHLQMRQLG